MWARGGKPDGPGVDDDLALMGISAEQPAEWAGERQDDEGDFEVWPENMLALRVFLSMRTQWQWTGGMQSYRCGLNHAVLPLHMAKAGVPKNKRYQIMDDVQIMEGAALEVWGEEAAAEARKQNARSGK